MQDGRTRKITRSGASPEAREFFQHHSAALVTLTGTTAGNEYRLDEAKLSLGRGPEADLRFDDAAMSREHAVFELIDSGFRVRDLGSTNGVLLNGHPTLVGEIKHGDRVQLGEHVFQFLLEEREPTPRAYVVDDEV